jgi:glycerophosphoryl diester phosphodiesterase
LALDTNIIPNGFECYVEALDCKYKYHENYNETDTGHWKLITSDVGNGESQTNYLHENKLGYIAHRGSSVLAPSNSLKAFELAGDFGYEAVEVDVQYTSDGVPVIMHDSTVDATTDGTGEVASMTLSEIKSLQLDTDFLGKDDEIIRVPTFEETIKVCKIKNLIMNIDCSKMVWTEDIMHDIVSRLKKYNMLDYCFFVMTNKEQRDLFLTLYPNICITWLSSDTTSDANIEYCNKHKNAFVTYSVNNITETLLEEYNNAGIPVFLYQCQTPELCEEYADYGVRFIETDYILPPSKIL